MTGFVGKIYITGPGSGGAENRYSFQEDLCELRSTRPAFKAQMYRNVWVPASGWYEKHKYLHWSKPRISNFGKFHSVFKNVITPWQHHLLLSKWNTQSCYLHWSCSKSVHQTEKSPSLDATCITNSKSWGILQWKKKSWQLFQKFK